MSPRSLARVLPAAFLAGVACLPCALASADDQPGKPAKPANGNANPPNPPGKEPPAPAPGGPAPAPGAPAPAAPAPAPAPAPKIVYPVQPYAGGTVFVDVSEKISPRVGTPVEVIFKLVGNRKDVLQQFLYETPAHKVVLEGFAMDATEVSNAQYLLWLDQTARTVYKTGTAAYSTLQQIAQGLVAGVDEKDNVAWAQLYELNKPALEAGNPDLKDKKKAEWQHASLQPDINLVVYSRRLPKHWFAASGVLADDAGPDHPVRDISYLDCRDFAEWAGKHVPKEEEWEWAARSPEQRTYPWGDDWVDGLNPLNGKRLIEKRCNWQDLGIVNARLEPTTLPVEALPEGRSWCGCWHMLGNVGEWTSSWFNTYPGWVGETDPAKNPLGKYTGDYVKVIRGASYIDRERLVLRSAARAFIGAGDTNPQKPENRFPNVGFRCAAYLRPGLDRLESVLAKLTRPKKIRDEYMDASRLGGAISVHWTPPGEVVPNHVHVLGRSATVLICPTKALNLKDEESPYAKTPADILDKTRTEEPKIFGAFHTDVPIVKVKIAVKATVVKRATRNIPEPTVSEKADQKIPAGSYIIGLWFGEVGLFTPNLDFVGFLGKPTVIAKNLEKPKDTDEYTPISTTVEVDTDGETAKFGVWMPIGGKGMPHHLGVLISWGNEFEAGAIDKAGKNWRDSPPIKK